MIPQIAGLTGAYLIWTASSGELQGLVFDCVVSEKWSEPTTITEHPVESGTNVSDNVRVGLITCQLDIFATQTPLGPNSFATPTPTKQTIVVPAPTWNPGNGIVDIAEWNNELAERGALTALGGLAGGLIGSATAHTGAGAGLGSEIGSAAGTFLGGLLFQPHEEDSLVQTTAGMVPTGGQTFYPTTQQFAQAEDFVQEMVNVLKGLKNSAQLIEVVGTKNDIVDMVIETLDIERDVETGTGARISLGLKQIRFVATSTVVAPKPTTPRANTPISKGTQNTTPANRAQDSAASKLVQSLTGSSAAQNLRGLFGGR